MCQAGRGQPYQQAADTTHRSRSGGGIRAAALGAVVPGEAVGGQVRGALERGKGRGGRRRGLGRRGGRGAIVEGGEHGPRRSAGVEVGRGVGGEVDVGPASVVGAGGVGVAAGVVGDAVGNGDGRGFAKPTDHLQ